MVVATPASAAGDASLLATEAFFRLRAILEEAAAAGCPSKPSTACNLNANGAGPLR
jgi:hypothetical protein